jgi:hypothetical protein
MAEDFVIETTNENGVVEQERVALNLRELNLSNRSLVRIVGPLERVTTLQELYVHRNQSISGVESHAILVLFVQLSHNCFVDVPACVLALTRLKLLWVSLGSLPDPDVSSLWVADSCAASIEPLVVSPRCHWSNDVVNASLCENCHRVRSRVSSAPCSRSLGITSSDCRDR